MFNKNIPALPCLTCTLWHIPNLQANPSCSAVWGQHASPPRQSDVFSMGFASRWNSHRRIRYQILPNMLQFGSRIYALDSGNPAPLCMVHVWALKKYIDYLLAGAGFHPSKVSSVLVSHNAISATLMPRTSRTQSAWCHRAIQCWFLVHTWSIALALPLQRMMPSINSSKVTLLPTQTQANDGGNGAMTNAWINNQNLTIWHAHTHTHTHTLTKNLMK